MTLDDLAAQHVALLEQIALLWKVFVVLSIIGVVSMAMIGVLAAWSVQRVTTVHQREFAMILELLAKSLASERSQ